MYVYIYIYIYIVSIEVVQVVVVILVLSYQCAAIVVLVRGCKQAIIVVMKRGHIPACACVGPHVYTVFTVRPRVCLYRPWSLILFTADHVVVVLQTG
jgi:hypothetical protein